MSLTELGYRVISLSYELVFKEQMSQNAQKLVFGTSYAGVGVLLGALLTFLFNIVAARILGPDNFGNFALITAVGAILVLSMSLFLTPTVKYASGAADNSTLIRILSTSFIQSALITIVSVAIFVVFSPQLSQVIGIPRDVFLFSVIYAVVFTSFLLTMNVLRILFRMKAYALFSAVQAAIALAVFLALFGNNVRSWQAAALAWSVSYAAVSLVLALYLRKCIKPTFDTLWSKKILTYSMLVVPGTAAGAFMVVDRILINRFSTTADVGIYNAYFQPSITFALMVWGILNAAFFPYACRSPDRRSILSNVNKVAPYLIASFVPSILVVETVAFVFYGSRYPFSLEVAFFFALGARCALFFSVQPSRGLRRQRWR